MTTRRMPWDDPHEHLEDMEHAELRMLRWIINAQVTIGRTLIVLMEGQEKIVADLTALTAQLEEVKASAEVASAAVLAALDATSAQIADLKAQIDALTVGAVTQEQIDALADADAIVDSITAAVTPAV
jgi:cell division protein FtsB